MKRDNPANLTREALEDDWIGLHEEVAELRRDRKAAQHEIADLKATIRQFETMEGGRNLGNALRAASTAKGRMAEHQRNAARLQRQVNAQQAEIARLKKQLENQIIPLN